MFQKPRHNQNKKQEEIKRYTALRNWIYANPNITLEDLLKQEEVINRVDIVQLLIKSVLEHNEYIGLLKELASQNYLPKTTTKTRYSLYNIAAYIKSCSGDFFRELINVVHLFGYSIFDQNNKGENAFMAIMSENNTLSIPEKHFRYMTISQITPEQISRLAVSCFNKLNSEDKITMDRLRFALCVNPKCFIVTIAKLLIMKKCSESCIIRDLYIFQYVKIIIDIFKNSDVNNYSKVIVTDKSLDLFFKLNKNKTMKYQDLFNTLWKDLVTIACNDDDPNKIFNMHSLAITIGAFANYGILLEEYRFFILECLKVKNSQYNIDYEERPKLVIRAILHAKKISPEIITNLKEFPIKDGFINTTVIRLSNKDDSIYKTNIAKPLQKAILDINSLKFFEGLTSDNVEDVIDDTVYILEKAISSHPDKKIDIVRRLMFCLFESVHNLDNISIIITNLSTCITKSDIMKNKKYIEMNIIPSVDNPISSNIWRELNNSL